MINTHVIKMKESKHLEKIQLKHLIIPFFILGAGWFLVLSVFMFEKIFGERFTVRSKNMKSKTFSAEWLRYKQT